jgi:hypothetical protein
MEKRNDQNFIVFFFFACLILPLIELALNFRIKLNNIIGVPN